jgi:hypothetical protein
MSEKKLHKALVAVCGKVTNVKRDTVGQAGRGEYKYATIDAVLDVLQPLFRDHGLALVQYVRGDSLISELHHEDGEVWAMGEYNLGAFADSQKRGSAITYGRRYQLCSIFGIAQEDDDGKSASEATPAFKNAALRNTFFANVVKSWEACESTIDLAERKKLDDVKLKEMSVGVEHDQLAYDELKKRYAQLYKGLKDAERLNRQADAGDFSGLDHD